MKSIDECPKCKYESGYAEKTNLCPNHEKWLRESAIKRGVWRPKKGTKRMNRQYSLEYIAEVLNKSLHIKKGHHYYECEAMDMDGCTCGIAELTDMSNNLNTILKDKP